MVFQKPNPFPKSIYDNVAYGPKVNGMKVSKHGRRRRGEPARAALWDEVKDKLEAVGLRAVRRPAAAAVHRAHHRRQARGHPHGRAVLGARPDRDARASRTSCIELKQDYTIVIVTHNMQQAARVADRTAFFTAEAAEGHGDRTGHLVEFDETHEDLQQPRRTRAPRTTSPAASADRGPHPTHPDFVRLDCGLRRGSAKNRASSRTKSDVNVHRRWRMPVLSTGDRLALRDGPARRHGVRMHLDLAALPEVFLAAEASAVDVDARRLRTAVAAGTTLRSGADCTRTPPAGPHDRVERAPSDSALAAGGRSLAAFSATSSAAAAHGLPTPTGHPATALSDRGRPRRSRSPGSWMTLYRGELSSGARRVEWQHPPHRRLTNRRGLRPPPHHRGWPRRCRRCRSSRKATAAGVRDMREFQTRWPGSQKTEIMLAQLDPRREGWLESWSADAFRRMELPRWIPQVNVYDAHDCFVGRRGRVLA